MFFLTLLFFTQQSQDSLTDSLNIKGRDGFIYQAKFLHYGTAPIGFYPYSFRSNFLNFQIDGELRNGMKVEGEFFESDNPNTQARGLIKATTETYGFAVGDISLPENFLQKSVIGLYSQGKYENFSGAGFYSAPKGEIKFQVFNGNLTQGPFYLSYTPVVYNSEIVWIRRGEVRSQQIKGQDYEIDYRSGTITFLKRIIEREEIIEVIYETNRIDFTKPFYGGRFGAEYKGLEGGLSQQVYDSLKITGADFGVNYGGANLRGDYKKMGDANSRRVSSEFSRGFFWLNCSYENNDLAFAGLERRIFQQEFVEANSGIKLGVIDISGGGMIRQGDPEKDSLGEAATGGKGEKQNSYRYYFNGEFAKDSKKIDYLYEHSKTMEFGFENSHTIKGEYDQIYLLYNKRINNLYVGDRAGIGIRRFEIKKITFCGRLEQEWHNKKWFKTNYEASSGLNFKKIRGDVSYYRYLTINDGSDILSSFMTLKPFEQVRLDGQYRIETKNTILNQKTTNHNGRAGIQVNPVKTVTLATSTSIRRNYLALFKQLDYVQYNHSFEFQKERFSFLSNLINSRTRAYNIRNLQQKTADEKGKIIGISSRFKISEKISVNPQFKREENIGLGFFIPGADSTDTMSIQRREIKTDRAINSVINLREDTDFNLSAFYNSYYNFLGDTSLYNYRTIGLDTKLSERVSDFFTILGLFGLSRRDGADPLLSRTDTNLIFYTISPGLGAKLTLKNLAAIEGEYRINQSVGETKMRLDEFKFNAKGISKNLTGGVGFVLRQGHNPDYGISEINCNLTLNL